jgi:hypothetical protein
MCRRQGGLFGKVTSILVLLTSLAACVEFKPALLYTGDMIVTPPPKPERISQVVEPTIFSDDNTDVWGLEDNECQTAEVSTEVVHEGRASLKVVWNTDAPLCNWAGIGIGWEGYAGKDLSALMDNTAISMYVRTVEGRAFGLPFVLTLEDYSGGMGFCYTSNKYFERSSLDEEWQRVVVPLADFDLETENLDVTNIKQLQIELQQSGAVYLDNLELAFYQPEPQEPWLEEEKLPNPIALPITLFDDAFINNNGWGLVTDACQDIALTNEDPASGSKAIHAVWNRTDPSCHLTTVGVSWNKWHPVNVRPILENAAIQFKLKMVSSTVGKEISIEVGLEDYDRAKAGVTLQNAYSASGRYTQVWSTVTIPLSSLPADIDFNRIKHLYFDFVGAGECYIDDIKLVEQLP